MSRESWSLDDLLTLTLIDDSAQGLSCFHNTGLAEFALLKCNAFNFSSKHHANVYCEHRDDNLSNPGFEPLGSHAVAIKQICWFSDLCENCFLSIGTQSFPSEVRGKRCSEQGLYCMRQRFKVVCGHGVEAREPSS